MAFCIKCGKQNKDDAKFCTGCGNVLINAVPVVDSKPSIIISKRKRSWLLLAGLILLAAILTVYFLFIKQKTSSPKEQESSVITYNSDNTNTHEAASQDEIRKIKDLIHVYYSLLTTHDCMGVNNFYEPVISNLYDHKNRTRDEALTDCIAYYERWPYQSVNVDYGSMDVYKLSSGGYFTTYHLDYLVRRNENDNWKKFNLIINIEFDQALKIKSMYEIKKQ